MIKFKDLYNALKSTEVAYERMGVDIDAAICGMPKCVLTNAQVKLLDSYMDLANIDVDFCELDFQAIIEKIDECFMCVTDEFQGLLPPPLPEPEETANACQGSVVVPIEHIRRFRIYEYTDVSADYGDIQVYVVPKENLPSSFVPSVPDRTRSQERYYVSWNEQRHSLRVRVDHDLYPESMGAPDGSFNIAAVVAEIDPQFQDFYGNRSEVRACAAYLMTPGINWKTNHGLLMAVDGLNTTYTAVDGNAPEVTVEFQFRA